VCAVLSGNRNFDGRIHPQVRAAYLASPALVVALALAGNVRGDLETDPLEFDRDGRPVYLADLWPDDAELAELEARYVVPEVFRGDEPASSGWRSIVASEGVVYPWTASSTYVRRPPYVAAQMDPLSGEAALRGARALVLLGDNVSTDHISPVGAIPVDSPAGTYLRDCDVAVAALNSYGARRGNHEVMMRGTFANPRLRNQMLTGFEGGYTLHVPSGERVPIFEAAARYASTQTPLLVLAGKAYGMGSSRDWAAKGPKLLGVRAVIAESFERIHRANLCAMGILPLMSPAGGGWASIGLDGREEYVLEPIGSLRASGRVLVRARRDNGDELRFEVRVDIHSQGEWDLLEQGGMLPYLLGKLAA